MYTDFRRVEISDQLAREPLRDNLVQSTSCIVILLIFGLILHELSCTEPVLDSPLRLSTLYSSCSMWELGKAKCTPITGAWLPFLFVSSAAGDWIRTVLLIDKFSILSDTPRPTLYSLEKEKRQETPQASSLCRVDPAARRNWVPSPRSRCLTIDASVVGNKKQGFGWAGPSPLSPYLDLNYLNWSLPENRWTNSSGRFQSLLVPFLPFL